MKYGVSGRLAFWVAYFFTEIRVVPDHRGKSVFAPVLCHLFGIVNEQDRGRVVIHIVCKGVHYHLRFAQLTGSHYYHGISIGV